MTLEKIKAIIILTDLMQKEHGATLADMSAALGCSVRSLHRLIKIMLSYNIPLHQTWDKSGNTNSKRWKIIISEWVSPIEVKPDPRITLLFRLLVETVSEKTENLGIGESGGKHKRLQKKDILRNLTQERFKFIKTNYTTFKGYKDYSEKEDLLVTLSENVQKQIAITISYQSPKNQNPKQYVIHPYTIVSHDNGLYLLAAVPKHDGRVIVLAVERIISIDEVSDSHFMIPDSYDPDKFLSESFGITPEAPIRVEVCFDQESSFYAAERVWGKDQQVISQEDGSITVSFLASGVKEIARWVLSYGCHARVLGPGELVNEIRKETRGLEAMYQ